MSNTNGIIYMYVCAAAEGCNTGLPVHFSARITHTKLDSKMLKNSVLHTYNAVNSIIMFQ